MNVDTEEFSMKIYFARAMTGKSYQEIKNYYSRMHSIFRKKYGEKVLTFFPIACKDRLDKEKEVKSHGYNQFPVSTDHAILERDLWMVAQSDIVFVNLQDTTKVSIGSCMELAVACWLRKHTIVVLPKGNVHTHAFVLEAADIVFTNEEDAMAYLFNLLGSTGGYSA